MAKHNKYEPKAVEFKFFLALWNQTQGLGTPAIHFRMADWLEHCWKTGEKNLLLMAFRSSGKSTIVGIFAAWLLYRWPDLRILVLAADSKLAGKMVRNVKRIIERHPLTGGMKPEKADQWASDRFSVKRMIERRDPSMMAAGISSNITGSRADVIICDDVEVPNTCDGIEKRENLREALSELSYVQVDQGATQLYIGTPHTYYTIYADEPRDEIGEDRAFLDGYKRLEIPLLNEQGQSIWPERFDAKAVLQFKRQSGPNKFASQMMLKPVNIAEGTLDMKQLIFYGEDLDYTPELKTLFLGRRKMVSASAWWDPALGKDKGDNSVLAILYRDEENNHFLHHVEYIKPDPNGDIDPANQQCRMVAECLQEHMIPVVYVETNGIGGLIPGLLRNALGEAGIPCRVQEKYNNLTKAQRILDAFDPLLAWRRLYISNGVKRTPFLVEMREWRPDRTRCKDDGLDAVAGAISAIPITLSSEYVRGAYEWMKGTKAKNARTDFEV